MEESSAKRLTTDMLKLEQSHVIIIPPEFHYCLKIRTDRGYTSNLSKMLLKSDPKPIFVYYNEDTILLFFSCVGEDNEHQLSGNHSKLVSKYTSIVLVDRILVMNVI